MILLESKHICKNFGPKPALRDVNVTIECGKIVGLLGPNGSGKTTFLKLINGLLTPSSGELIIGGERPGVITKQHISYLPDQTIFPKWMKISDLFSYYDDFFVDFDKNKAEEMLKRLDIVENMRLKHMSKGTQEKVQLILTMSRNANLYCLDEPIGGVDPATRDYILQTIISNYSENASVLLSTHLISDVESILDDVIFLQDGERRIPVQYSKKMAGRKMVGGQSSNIPLKVNTAGVIPIIFASSIMSFPSIILSFVGKSDIKGIGGTLIKMLNSNNWFDKTNPVASLGLILYIVLVIFFAYFYTSITFNPMEVADNMKKQGGFIPGIRPGKSTVDYLNNLLSYIIFIGAAGLTIVAVIPFFFNGFFKANVSFGGTSLIIIASVILETLKQIESMMLVRNYKGFLND